MVSSSRALRSIIPSSAALHTLDIVLALWVAAWIGLGIAIGINVSDLSSLSHTAIRDGHAVQSVGRSLSILGTIPLLGGSLSGVAHQVQVAGASAVAGGTNSQSSIQALSILLAVAVALLPSVPVFGFYLPVRLDMRREARALRNAVRSYGDDPAFQAFLARRAIDSLGYHRLRRVAALPWSQSVSPDDYAELAAAELTRLGIEPELLEQARRGGAPGPPTVGDRNPVTGERSP